MILVPKWSKTEPIMRTLWIFLPLMLLYCAFIIPAFFNGALADFANPQFGIIQDLLGSPQGTLLAWVHILTFDLFVGRWIFLNSKETAVGRLGTGIALFFTLMSGPFGLLIYLVIRKKAA